MVSPRDRGEDDEREALSEEFAGAGKVATYLEASLSCIIILHAFTPPLTLCAWRNQIQRW